MLKSIGALFDRACAVLGAFAFAQFPLFISQYQHQLTGREAEMRLQVDAIQRAASLSGKTLPQFIQKFTTNADLDFVRQGELMQAMVDRWYHLNDALIALQNSSTVGRPLNFLVHLNTDAFKSTLKHYSFGLPLTIEGAIYALFGIITGYLLVSGLRKIGNHFLMVSKINRKTI